MYLEVAITVLQTRVLFTPITKLIYIEYSGRVQVVSWTGKNDNGEVISTATFSWIILSILQNTSPKSAKKLLIYKTIEINKCECKTT